MKKKPSNSLIILNSDLITKVISELGNENFTFIIKLIEEFHPADTADLLETLNSEDRKKVVKIIKENFESEDFVNTELKIKDRNFECKQVVNNMLWIDFNTFFNE